MGTQSFFDTVREFIGSIAFAVYLWSVRMTPDEFWDEQEKAAQQSVQRTCFYCDENKAPAKETICQDCVNLLSDASR